jgi:uncharacterized membrane protein YhiD involved in acid resistance
MSSIFNGIFDTSTTSTVSVQSFLIALVAALILGAAIAVLCTRKTYSSKSFTVTAAILPAIVCVVIMAVNGNVGAGVAVAGAFGLVRFRSAPGTAREIAVLFMAMGTGLLCGMGYIAFAVLFTAIVCLVFALLNLTSFGERGDSLERVMKMTVPEDVDYTVAFNDVFKKYTTSCTRLGSKTAGLGSLFRLTYRLKLKNATQEKAFIDELRCLNGNLEIIMHNIEGSGENDEL